MSKINYLKIPYNVKVQERLKENGKLRRLKKYYKLFLSCTYIFIPITVCEIIENVSSLSIFIDCTLKGSTEIREMLQLQHIPYYNFDFSIQSFVKVMESYIKVRTGMNTVFILQDETSNLCYVYIFEMRKKWVSFFLSFFSHSFLTAHFSKRFFFDVISGRWGFTLFHSILRTTCHSIEWTVI